MAMLRNLRNVLEATANDESIDQVCSYLSNAEAVKNSKQLPFRFLSAYLQLKELEIHANRPLQDAINETTQRIRQIEEVVEKRNAGFFRVWVRKVVRYNLVNTIGQCAKLHGSFKYGKPILHSSRRGLCWVHTEQPSRRMQKELRQLENVLQGLQKRESLLRRKQALLEEKYGSPWLKKAKHYEMILQALEDAACHSAVNISGFDESTRVLLASGFPC